MPNGLPSPKSFLQQQAQMPSTILANTPLAALGQGLSGVLSQIAGTLPELPALPAGMGLPGLAATAPTPAPVARDQIKAEPGVKMTVI